MKYAMPLMLRGNSVVHARLDAGVVSVASVSTCSILYRIYLGSGAKWRWGGVGGGSLTGEGDIYICRISQIYIYIIGHRPPEVY